AVVWLRSPLVRRAQAAGASFQFRRRPPHYPQWQGEEGPDRSPPAGDCAGIAGAAGGGDATPCPGQRSRVRGRIHGGAARKEISCRPPGTGLAVVLSSQDADACARSREVPAISAPRITCAAGDQGGSQEGQAPDTGLSPYLRPQLGQPSLAGQL